MLDNNRPRPWQGVGELRIRSLIIIQHITARLKILLVAMGSHEILPGAVITRLIVWLALREV